MYMLFNSKTLGLSSKLSYQNQISQSSLQRSVRLQWTWLVVLLRYWRKWVALPSVYFISMGGGGLLILGMKRENLVSLKKWRDESPLILTWRLTCVFALPECVWGLLWGRLARARQIQASSYVLHRGLVITCCTEVREDWVQSPALLHVLSLKWTHVLY